MQEVDDEYACDRWALLNQPVYKREPKKLKNFARFRLASELNFAHYPFFC